MHPFRKLLLISLDRDSSFEKDPSPQDWLMMFNMAKYQAMLGVTNYGVHRLPERQLPPEHILSHWDALAAKIEEIHGRHERHVAELGTLFGRIGLQGCILKGTGLARLYPDPGRRQCGDIDVWVPGPRRSVINAFSEEFEVHDIVYRECKVDIFDDTVVEVHFRPSKMSNPFCNARLQRWLRKNSPIPRPGQGLNGISGHDRLSGQELESPLYYPTPEFNAVFCMSHMYRHYIGGGLGLRQMLDYYYVLKSLPADRRGSVMKTLKRLGIGRFTAATMLCLQFNFGLEDEYLLCPPDRKHGPKLINDLIRMGNFGVLNPHNHARPGESRLAGFHRKNRRSFSNLRYYPREVLWTPFARLTHFLWRLFRGYL